MRIEVHSNEARLSAPERNKEVFDLFTSFESSALKLLQISQGQFSSFDGVENGMIIKFSERYIRGIDERRIAFKKGVESVGLRIQTKEGKGTKTSIRVVDIKGVAHDNSREAVELAKDFYQRLSNTP